MVMASAPITVYTLSLAVLVSTIAFHLRGLHNSFLIYNLYNLKDPYMCVTKLQFWLRLVHSMDAMHFYQLKLVHSMDAMSSPTFEPLIVHVCHNSCSWEDLLPEQNFPLTVVVAALLLISVF
jgi:hypothetical protein